MSLVDPVILVAACLAVSAVERPRIRVYHDYVYHITTERPHLFRSVCHMNLDEAKALAFIIGVEPVHSGHFKLSGWDRFVIFLIGAAQGTTTRHLESHLHLAKSAVAENFKHFSARIVNIMNQPTSGLCYVMSCHVCYVRLFVFFISCYVMLRFVLLYYVMSCDVMLSYAILCYDMLACAIRGFNKPYETLHIWKNIIGYVDGTHVRVQRPSDAVAEVAHYSEHKKTHTVLFMVIVDIRGRVVYCSPGYAPGRASEKALFSLCDIFIPQQVWLNDVMLCYGMFWYLMLCYVMCLVHAIG